MRSTSHDFLNFGQQVLSAAQFDILYTADSLWSIRKAVFNSNWSRDSQLRVKVIIECYAVSDGKYLLTFQKLLVLRSYSGLNSEDEGTKIL
jgi:hypothetical protein